MGSHVETDVTEFLRGAAAATFDALADSVGVSKRTVRRALKKVGYYSSINLDSTWVALRETPRFNPDGLWRHGEACFSSNGSLIETVKNLIVGSEEGRTVLELEKRVRTRVHQAVNACLTEQWIGRFYLGRYAVYVSADREVAASQEARRLGRMEAEKRLSNLSSISVTTFANISKTRKFAAPPNSLRPHTCWYPTWRIPFTSTWSSGKVSRSPRP